MKPWQYILLGLMVAVAIVISFLVGRISGRNEPGETPTPRVDTLFIHDTTKVIEPRFYAKRVIDSVLVPVVDTIMVRDSVFIALAREQVTWEDSLARVYASGIDPKVDSVVHYTTQMVITKEIPVVQKDRWGLGIQVGGGYGRGGFTPYVGVGVSYNILTWSFKRKNKNKR